MGPWVGYSPKYPLGKPIRLLQKVGRKNFDPSHKDADDKNGNVSVIRGFDNPILTTIMWLGFFHINASSRLFNVK